MLLEVQVNANAAPVRIQNRVHGMVTRVWAEQPRNYGLIPVRDEGVCSSPGIKTNCGSLPASYRMCSGGFSLSAESTVVQSGPLTSVSR